MFVVLSVSLERCCQLVTHTGTVDDSRDFLIPSGHIVVTRLSCALSDLRLSLETIHFGSSDNNSQSITHQGLLECQMRVTDVFCARKKRLGDLLDAHAFGLPSSRWRKVPATENCW